MKVRLDVPETEDWIKPPKERAKSAARRRVLGGGRDGTGSPPDSDRRLKKHYGPGPHPNGSPQSVHGGGGSPQAKPDVEIPKVSREVAAAGLEDYVRSGARHFKDPSVFGIEKDDMFGSYCNRHTCHWNTVMLTHEYDGMTMWLGWARRTKDGRWFEHSWVTQGRQINDDNPYIWETIPEDRYAEYLGVPLNKEQVKSLVGQMSTVDALFTDYYDGPDYDQDFTTVKWRVDLWEKTRDEILGKVEKHYGPGPHPGTGTPQSIHGGGPRLHPQNDQMTELSVKRREAAQRIKDSGNTDHESFKEMNRLDTLMQEIIDARVAVREHRQAIEDYQADPEDYRGGHQPSTEGAPLSDLSRIVPEDVYTHPEWYFTFDEPYNREAMAIAHRVRGNPEAKVAVYRAVPKSAKDEINPGDWVTTSRNYAELHASSSMGGYYDHKQEWHPNPSKIIKRTVTAKELVWPGDAIAEYGWFPEGSTLGVEKRRKVKTSPGFPHGPSIKWPKVYEALRREGHDKSSAAAISNAHWNKYRRWGRAGNPGPKSAADYEEKRGRKARKRKGIPLPKSRRKSIVKHPWRGSQIHSTGTDQSVHGHSHAEATGNDHPDAANGYEHASAHADDLLDIDLDLNGKHYRVDGTEVPDTEDLTISGDMFNPDGDDVGDFTWTADEDYPEWVKLNLVVIDASERGSGLGLTVIREWEKRLGEVGFEGMELQADAMGKYFWAVYGYGWELGSPPDHFVDHVKRSIERPAALVATVRAMSSGSGDVWPDEFPQKQWDQLADVLASPDPEPVDFASVGAGDGSGYHLGKAIMLTAEPWFGVKDIEQ